MTANGREITGILETNNVDLWLEGDRLCARWTGEGEMHPGADGFIRRFRNEIVATLRERENTHTEGSRAA